MGGEGWCDAASGHESARKGLRKSRILKPSHATALRNYPAYSSVGVGIKMSVKEHT